eukprot:TRINITY_DN643_c0_g1_i1.p1 TRINITY_DN643_c0_g1~~TRINITY_DN643_c0_g1_i1.p1  ORF type:complete len:357 (-),score=61.38 TRINITY_DN643_c0_g1_i1:81-1151(-)
MCIRDRVSTQSTWGNKINCKQQQFLFSKTKFKIFQAKYLMQHFIKLILCFTLIGSLLAENQLITSLQEQAKKIAATIPSDYSKLIMEIKTNGLDGFDSCEVSGFNQMIAKYDFTQAVIDNFKTVTFSESVEFQSFYVNIKNEIADVIEFLGTGINQNGTIQIAFVYLFAEGTPIPQFTSHKSCHDCHVFFKCCETTYTERPFTQSEIDIITNTVRGNGYQQVEQFLANPPQRLTDFPQRVMYLMAQNAWDIAMSSWLLYSIEKNSTCYSDIETGYKDCKTGSTDQQNACMVKKIPENQQFEACILVICSKFYFASPAMPISDQTCFSIFYPNVSNKYDLQIEGNNKINTVHFWNFE